MNRPMRTFAAGNHADERGFLLVGVVIFVFALTLIGLSLFSLSSFEAQFMGTSLREAQAFYYATGGIERAKNVLDSEGNLDAVKSNLPFEHVIYAQAWNATGTGPEDTSGTFDWNGTDRIRIRAMGEFEGVRRMVEAEYIPQRDDGIYSNLITTPTILKVMTVAATPLPAYNPVPQTRLAGRVQQGINDFSWVTYTPNAYGQPHDTTYVPTTPQPDVDSYISTWKSHPSTVTLVPNAGVYNLSVPLLPGFKHYIGPAMSGGSSESGFGFYEPGPAVINVGAGTAIWMVEAGMFFETYVQVNGLPLVSRLVIVANTSPTNTSIATGHPPLPNAGIWIEGQIQSNIPVILITDGTIVMDHFSLFQEGDTELPYVSMFAGGVLLKGPRAGHELDIRHPISAFGLLDEEILEPLYQLNILPNGPVSGAAQFTLQPGTWREVTESNPN